MPPSFGIWAWGQCYVCGVWNLSRATVVRECREQADDGSWALESDSHQIGVREGWLFGQSVEAAGHQFHFAAVPESVKRSRVNFHADRFSRSQHSMMLSEQLARARKSGLSDRHWIDLTDSLRIVRMFYPAVAAIILLPSNSPRFGGSPKTRPPRAVKLITYRACSLARQRRPGSMEAENTYLLIMATCPNDHDFAPRSQNFSPPNLLPNG